jgi:hypothetical protein
MEKEPSLTQWQRSARVFRGEAELSQKGRVHVVVRLAYGQAEKGASLCLTVKDTSVLDVYKFIERQLFERPVP